MNAYGLGLPEAVLASSPRRMFDSEKRQSPRRQLSVRCWLADGQHTIFARIHDVSQGGLSMRVPVPFSLGTELEIALTTSGQGGGLVVPVRAIARVVWLRTAESGPRMGTRFLEFPDGPDGFGQLCRLIDRR